MVDHDPTAEGGPEFDPRPAPEPVCGAAEGPPDRVRPGGRPMTAYLLRLPFRMARAAVGVRGSDLLIASRAAEAHAFLALMAATPIPTEETTR